ncbi:hypothetical protein BGZ65_011703, partial [Modicella reniformis]
SARSIDDRSPAPLGEVETRDQDVSQYDAPLLLDTAQYPGFEMEPPELELRRQASAHTGNTPMDLGIGDIGVSSLGSSERLGGHMPWSIDVRAGVDTRSEHSSGSDRLRRDFETIFDPTLGIPVKRQRKLSATSGSFALQDLQDEHLNKRYRHLTPTGSRSGSQPRSSSHYGSQWGSRATSRQRDDGATRESSTDDYFMADPGAQEHSESQERITLDRETINFLNYIRSILREANARSFSFSDVISVHRRRDVAASAFYHVL